MNEKSLARLCQLNQSNLKFDEKVCSMQNYPKELLLLHAPWAKISNRGLVPPPADYAQDNQGNTVPNARLCTKLNSAISLQRSNNPRSPDYQEHIVPDLAGRYLRNAKDNWEYVDKDGKTQFWRYTGFNPSGDDPKAHRHPVDHRHKFNSQPSYYIGVASDDDEWLSRSDHTHRVTTNVKTKLFLTTSISGSNEALHLYTEPPHYEVSCFALYRNQNTIPLGTVVYYDRDLDDQAIEFLKSIGWFPLAETRLYGDEDWGWHYLKAAGCSPSEFSKGSAKHRHLAESHFHTSSRAKYDTTLNNPQGDVPGTFDPALAKVGVSNTVHEHDVDVHMSGISESDEAPSNPPTYDINALICVSCAAEWQLGMVVPVNWLKARNELHEGGALWSAGFRPWNPRGRSTDPNVPQPSDRFVGSSAAPDPEPFAHELYLRLSGPVSHPQSQKTWFPVGHTRYDRDHAHTHNWTHSHWYQLKGNENDVFEVKTLQDDILDFKDFEHTTPSKHNHYGVTKDTIVSGEGQVALPTSDTLYWEYTGGVEN